MKKKKKNLADFLGKVVYITIFHVENKEIHLENIIHGN